MKEKAGNIWDRWKFYAIGKKKQINAGAKIDSCRTTPQILVNFETRFETLTVKLNFTK